MVISFLDGIKIAEPGVMSALKRCLHRLIRKEDSVVFYFYICSDFILQCEWIARELMAAFPQKRIERVGVTGANEDLKFAQWRFDRCEQLSVQKPADVWQWMVDQSDYTCTYMHPHLCTSRTRLTTYQYALKHLGIRCLNFATEAAWERICALIPTLPRWQRISLEMKMRGELQRDIAKVLGVSRYTIHSYVLDAQYHLIEKAYPAERPRRQCAILGFTSTTIPSEQKAALREVILYLGFCCGVDHFIVQSTVERQSPELIYFLKTICQSFAHGIKISTVEPEKLDLASFVINQETGRVNRSLKEREAMIKRADIVLCSIQYTYGSGLNYAKRGHTPVINLAAQDEIGVNKSL